MASWEDLNWTLRVPVHLWTVCMSLALLQTLSRAYESLSWHQYHPLPASGCPSKWNTPLDQRIVESMVGRNTCQNKIELSRPPFLHNFNPISLWGILQFLPSHPSR